MTKRRCVQCDNTRVIQIAPFQHSNPTPRIITIPCGACAPPAKLTREGFKKISAAYHDRNTPCRADGCRHGYVVVDPLDIDPYTEEPRTSPCPACKGTMFVPRQLELFPAYKAAPDNE